MNARQEYACSRVLGGKSVFLTGCPGTGKSYCLGAIIAKFKGHRRRFGVTALTGCAALLIEGATVHSFLSIGLAKPSAEDLYRDLLRSSRYILYYKNKLEELIALQVLIIDEISMMNAELLDKVSEYLSLIRKNVLPFGGVQVVFVGDFYQLPPVTGRFCFESETWYDSNMETIVLTEQMRQNEDTVFKDILSRARVAEPTHDDLERLSMCEGIDPPAGVKYTRLYSLNINVDEINLTELNDLLCEEPTPEWRTYKLIGKHSITLCIGAQVMVTRNLCLPAGICNGTRGVVESLGDNDVTITLVNGMSYNLEYTQTLHSKTGVFVRGELDLKLAWAVTIHKSQGSTIDLLEIDLGTSVFAAGQAYVGLSRAISLDKVRVTSVCREAFKVDDRVVDFYDEVTRESERTMQKVCCMV